MPAGKEGAGRRRRRRPPWWVWALVALPLGLVAWIRLGDPLGDRGVTNSVSFVLSALAAAILFLWLVLLSGFSGRARLASFLVVAALAGGFRGLVRVEGFDGEMVPALAWRFDAGGRASVPVVPAVAAARPAVDLATTTPRDFPGFLGPSRDGRVPGARLARDWRARPPELAWRRAMGAGWSAFAVVNGVAVTLEQRDGAELVTAYDAESGEPLWVHSHPGHFDHFLGGAGPRSTPSVAGGRVFALGVQGRLVCLEGADGELVWERDLLGEWGVRLEDEERNVQYGRANSPLVAGGLVIVPVGGARPERMAGLVAFDAETGATVWEGPPRQISFSSPALATLASVEQVLIVNEDTLSGHDPASGRLLWEHDWPGRTASEASVSQAVPIPPARVLVSKGYGGGAMLLELEAKPDGTSAAREVWRDRRVLRTKLTNVVLLDGHVYGLNDGMLECVELESGRRVWKRGRYHHGQILLAGDLLLVLSEDGELVLVEPRPDEPARELGRVRALEGKTWNNLALTGDLLLVRNGTEAAAWRLPLADD